MDAGKKSEDNGHADAMEIAKGLAKIRGGNVLLRPATSKEPNCKWVLEVDGVGRVYFDPNKSVNSGKQETQVFTFKKRAARKRADSGNGESGGGGSVQP